jgi:hypothetical protein
MTGLRPGAPEQHADAVSHETVTVPYMEEWMLQW